MSKKRTTKRTRTEKPPATGGFAMQVVGKGYRAAPLKNKISPVLDAAIEAAQWLKNFMPVEGRESTTYRTRPTGANLYGWGHSMAAVRRVMETAFFVGFFNPEHSGDMVFIAGLNTQQSIAVSCLCESAMRIEQWADKCRESRKKTDPLSSLPAAMADEFHEAVRVFSEESRDYTPGDEYSSKRYKPKDLRELFDVNQDTLKSRLDSQQIRNIKHSDRAYQIHKQDLPSMKR